MSASNDEIVTHCSHYNIVVDFQHKILSFSVNIAVDGQLALCRNGELWPVSDLLHPIDLYPHTLQIWVEASQDDKHQRWSDKIPSLVCAHALSYTQSLLT